VSLSLAELTRLLPPQAPPPPAIPTGIAALDAVLLGGGLPRGRLTELLGPTGSGKTTLVRAIVEQTVSSRGWVAYIDAQRTLDPRDWTHLGDAEGVWMIRPHDAAKAPWCADVLLRSGAFTLVVLDGAPLLSKSNAVRLTRLARDGNCALMILGDRAGGATQLGGAVRLVVERPRRRETKEMKDTMSSRTIAVRVEKGGTLRTVEVSCAVPVARRLCTHPEVPDRRGVARGPAGGSRHARAGRPAPAPAHAAGGRPTVERNGHPARARLRAAVARTRALG
jgi:recombination protein RecA